MRELTTITLVCHNCGNSKNANISGNIMFAFELVKIANEVGMKGVLDMNYARALVFCDSKCAEDNVTKRGTYRAKSRAKDMP